LYWNKETAIPDLHGQSHMFKEAQISTPYRRLKYKAVVFFFILVLASEKYKIQLWDLLSGIPVFRLL
jgi:hypothetical protein